MEVLAARLPLRHKPHDLEPVLRGSTPVLRDDSSRIDSVERSDSSRNLVAIPSIKFTDHVSFDTQDMRPLTVCSTPVPKTPAAVLCAVYVGEKEVAIEPGTDKQSLVEKYLSSVRKAHEKSTSRQTAFITVFAESVVIDVEEEVLLQISVRHFVYCSQSQSSPTYFGVICRRDKKHVCFGFRRESDAQVSIRKIQL